MARAIRSAAFCPMGWWIVRGLWSSFGATRSYFASPEYGFVNPVLDLPRGVAPATPAPATWMLATREIANSAIAIPVVDRCLIVSLRFCTAEASSVVVQNCLTDTLLNQMHEYQAQY